jgi:oxalate decarboxylase
MTAPYVFHLGTAPVVPAGGGAVNLGATAADFPLLCGLSARVMTLSPGGVEGPRWYANAGVVAYCTQGTALVTILSPGNVRDCFTLAPDELFFVEQGFAYSIANASIGALELVAFLSHERPVACASAGRTGVHPSLARPSPGGTAGAPRATSPHKFAMREIEPVSCGGGGIGRTVSSEALSILDRLALCRLDLLPSGAEEPHWHPNCGELGYVLGGRALLSVMGPGGGIERLELQRGDLYFIPPAYPHWLEALGDAAPGILIGFGDHTPLRIGLRDVAMAFPGAPRACEDGAEQILI